MEAIVILAIGVLVVVIFTDALKGRFKPLTPVQLAWQQAEERARQAKRQAKRRLVKTNRRAPGRDIIKGEWINE